MIDKNRIKTEYSNYLDIEFPDLDTGYKDAMKSSFNKWVDLIVDELVNNNVVSVSENMVDISQFEDLYVEIEGSIYPVRGSIRHTNSDTNIDSLGSFE